MTPQRRRCVFCKRLTYNWQRINGGPWHCDDGCKSTTGKDRRKLEAALRRIVIGTKRRATPEMRARIRELANPPRDDFDRAVLAVLDDLEMMERAYNSAVKGRQEFRAAYRRALAEQKD